MKRHFTQCNITNSIPTLLVLSAVLLTQSVRSAIVTTTADDGPGSLRETIANAAPGETITFAVNGPVILTSGELVIDKDLMIEGPGSGALSIQRSLEPGTPDFRIFHVLSGTVNISGLTVNNGRADYGGGMLNEYDAFLRDVILSGNSATSEGGGLFNDGSMGLEDSVFIDNFVETIDGSGAYGGGIANWATIFWLDRCVFRNNSASGGSGSGGGFGGGINNSGTIFSMDSSVLENNRATGSPGTGYASGGAINNDFGTLTFTNCTLTGNSATGGAGGASGFGGGLNNDYGTVYVDASTVRDNVARGGSGSEGGLAEGGGVANGSGTVELTRSTVSGNLVVGGEGDDGGSGCGGGVANDGTLYLSSSTVSGNVANGGAGTVSAGVPHGGGLFNGYGALLADHSTVAANVVSGGAPNDGGGILNLGGFIRIKSTIVAANNATVDFFNDEYAETLSEGFNGIGSLAGLFTAGPAEQFNLTAATLQLGPLQDNGGPTFTHALRCGSPALEAGDNADAPDTDQRGFPRIVGVMDIGAYEASSYTAPTISCPSPITLNCAPPSGMVATVSVNVADADGDPLIVVWSVDGTAYQTNEVAAAGQPTTEQVDFTTVFAVGSHQVILSVSDPSGCAVTCSTTIEVGSFVPPTVNCPAPTSASAGANCQAPVPNILNSVTVSGGCASAGAITLSQSPAANTMVGVGTYTITVTATDGAGNSATCATTFTVTDSTPPTGNCPAPSTAEVDANCQASVPNVLGGMTVSDNCSGPGAITLTQSPAAGTPVGVGAYMITVTATDAAGNSATCTTSFTVTDNTPPVLVCPTVPDGYCQAAMPNVLSGVTVSDNCTPAGAITLNQSPTAGTLVGVGTHTITVTATDAAGNTATCTTTFRVLDNATLTAGGCSLGQAGGYAVFIMGNVAGTKSVISESGTKITGDAAIGPSVSGSSSDLLKATITGTLTLDPTAIVDIHPDLIINGGLVSQNLTAARNDALAASACFAALAPTRTFSSIGSSMTITGNGGVNVINVGSVVLVKKVLTLSGNANDVFIFNVSGDFTLGSAQIKLVGGVKASNVLWNFPGTTGTTVNVYKDVTSAIGTFLVPFRDYVQDNAVLNGSVIAGGNVRIHSGATVIRPTGCSP